MGLGVLGPSSPGGRDTSSVDEAFALSVDASGVATVAGRTDSSKFPTTAGAFDTAFNGGADAFVSRLDASQTGNAQLVYSTFMGGSGSDGSYALSVDANGFATVAGRTGSSNLPTTAGAFGRTLNGNWDAFVSRLDMLPTGVVRYGASTPACRGPIAIDVSRMPQSGDPKFAVTCGNAPPKTAGVLVLGAGQHLNGLPILGIRLHIDLLKPLILGPASSNGVGAANSPLPIPPATKGVRFFLQYVWLNTATCGGLGTLSASDALDITVQ